MHGHLYVINIGVYNNFLKKSSKKKCYLWIHANIHE